MFKTTGSVPRDRAICGSAVTITTPSRSSMKKATATMRTICVARRCRDGSSCPRAREVKACSMPAALDRAVTSHPRLPTGIRKLSRSARQYWLARFPADVISRSCATGEYRLTAVARFPGVGNGPVAPGCFNPEAATTTAQSGKKAHDGHDSHECPVPPGDDATRRDCLHLQ